MIHDELDSHPGSLFRGAKARNVEEHRAEFLNLRPGEMSLHHLRTLHSSLGNLSGKRRVGFAIRYVPAHVRNVVQEDSALLVRGEDRSGHYIAEQPPGAEGTPDTVARYEDAMARRQLLIFASHSNVAKPGHSASGNRESGIREHNNAEPVAPH